MRTPAPSTSQMCVAGPGLVLGRWLELGDRRGLGLGLSWRPAIGNLVDPGGGSVFGVRGAIGAGPLLDHGSDHGGDRPVFKVLPVIQGERGGVIAGERG